MTTTSRARTLFAILAACALPITAQPTSEGSTETASSSWSQFRGPERHGTIAEEGLLESWGESPPRELWRRDLGGGFSSVSAVGDRLYTMTLDGDDEIALCLDAASGETVWQTAVGKTGEAFPEGGPRTTPTVVNGVVYTASSQGRLVALSAKDGSLLWGRDLGESGPVPRFGYSVSPLVDGDLVIVETGKPEEKPGVVALDRATGGPRWQALDGPAGYSSPIAVEIAGVRQYVFFRRAAAEVVSLSTSGEVLWRHPTSGLRGDLGRRLRLADAARRAR
jgi:outer membrane protein assembly factor BamB